MVFIRRAVPPQYTMQAVDQAILVDCTTADVALVIPTAGTLGELTIPIFVVGKFQATIYFSGSDTCDTKSGVPPAAVIVMPKIDAALYHLTVVSPTEWVLEMMSRQSMGVSAIDEIAIVTATPPYLEPRTDSDNCHLGLQAKGTGRVFIDGQLPFLSSDASSVAAASKLVLGTSEAIIDPSWVRRLQRDSLLPDHREFAWYADMNPTAGGASTVSTVGTQILRTLIGGAPSAQDNDHAPWEQHITAATTGSKAGVLMTGVTKRSRRPLSSCRYRLGPNIQNVRHWIGFSDTDPTGVDALTTEHAMLVRFSTSAGDATAGAGGTPVFIATSCDGGGTPETTVTEISAANDVSRPEGYCFGYVMTASECIFLVDLFDGAGWRVIAVHTVMPASGTLLNFYAEPTTLVNTAKRGSWSFTRLMHS